MLYNVKIVPIWQLKNGQEFSWSLTMKPRCRLLRFNPQVLMYEWCYLDTPHLIGYSKVERTICLEK